MFWSPSFDGKADLTPYFNHVIASYTGIQTVPHVQECRPVGQDDRLRTLRPGSHGDVTILMLEEGRFTLRDRLSTATFLGRTRWEPPASVEAFRRLAHVNSIKAGRTYRPWLRPT